MHSSSSERSIKGKILRNKTKLNYYWNEEIGQLVKEK